MESYTVGVPVRNEQNTLISCVKSILNQTLKSNQILICVNGSTDNTHNIAKDLSKKYKNISVISSKPGKPNAWNEIVKHSKNNIMMMIDGDSITNKDAAKSLYLDISKNKKTLISSGRITYVKPKKETLFSKIFTEKYNEPIEVDFLCGALYMMKKKELIDYAKSLNIKLMPKDIILEDGLLDFITKGNKSRTQTSDAYATIIPIGNFCDWIKNSHKIHEGRMQLKEEYPNLQYNKEKGLKKKNISKRKKNLKIIKRIGFKLTYWMYKLVGLKTRLSKKNYNIIWKETKSTKQSFDKTNFKN